MRGLLLHGLHQIYCMPKILVVSSDPESMASDEAPEFSTQQLEDSMHQAEQSMTDQRKIASTETGSPRCSDSDHESRSSSSEDSETGSDNSRCLKVAAAVALAGISYDFGPSKIMKTHIGSMESHAHYFPKGYGQPPGAESVPEPRANEAIVLRTLLLPHPVLTDILHKFRVQLHHLTLKVIITISKFIWAVTSCGGHPTANIFAQHYELHYQHKKIHLEGCETTLAVQFGCITFHPSHYGGRVKHTLAVSKKWTNGWDRHWFYCRVSSEQLPL
jgi:hypothetical protein